MIDKQKEHLSVFTMSENNVLNIGSVTLGNFFNGEINYSQMHDSQYKEISDVDFNTFLGTLKGFSLHMSSIIRSPKIIWNRSARNFIGIS